MNCYLCGNTEFNTISDKLRYGEQRQVWQCKSCSLMFIYPYLTKEEEEKFYAEEYGSIYSKEKDVSIEDLFKSRYSEAEAYYELVKPYIKSTDNCLELGCASGYFLHYIQDKVSQISGFEPYIEFQNICRQFGVPLIENLNDVPNETYDKIFMFFLLEHLSDPITYINDVKRVLKQGGLLFLVLPNSNDALLSLYKMEEFKQFYFTLAHPYYYAKNNLEILLKKTGFEEFEIKPVQRYDLSNHMHWMLERKPGGQNKFSEVFSAELNNIYAENLKDHFACDTLFAVAKKT